MSVRTSGESMTTRPSWRPRLSWDQVVSATWLIGLALLAAIGTLSAWLPVWYALASLVTFAFYATDKAQAGVAKRRVPERWLHFLEAMGGWPGALVAQRWFRHKTRKTRFQVIFWGIVLVHFVVVTWYVIHTMSL